MAVAGVVLAYWNVTLGVKIWLSRPVPYPDSILTAFVLVSLQGFSGWHQSAPSALELSGVTLPLSRPAQTVAPSTITADSTTQRGMLTMNALTVAQCNALRVMMIG